MGDLGRPDQRVQAGARAPDVVRAPDELWATLLAQRVGVLGQTPSAFRALLPAAPRTAPSGLPLTLVVLGGESCEVARLAPGSTGSATADRAW
ncbi:hypothetical protein NKH77_07660 [Streptomyces sp. M19]